MGACRLREPMDTDWAVSQKSLPISVCPSQEAHRLRKACRQKKMAGEGLPIKEIFRFIFPAHIT